MNFGELSIEGDEDVQLLGDELAASTCAPSNRACDELELVVRRKQLVTSDVVLLEFAAANGGPLPAYAPGAHISLQLLPGLERAYSLIQPFDAAAPAYSICVKLEPQSRGGSRHIHDRLEIGDRVWTKRPANYFELDARAPHSVLIAGGIGITPLACMQKELAKSGRSFELHYAAKSRSTAALLGHVASAGAEIYLSEGGSRRLDIPKVIANAPAGSHFYCCGPQSMLAAFRAALSDVPAAQVHFETFATAEVAEAAGWVQVSLARSCRTLRVAPGVSILDALQSAGISIASSCNQGICGACETRVLAGTPDHRDAVLSDDERRAGKTMMVCCSRSKGDELVLDL